MSDKSAERVLVVPTAVFHEAGLFQGFNPQVDHYLPRLLLPSQLSYRPRSEVETDPPSADKSGDLELVAQFRPRHKRRQRVARLA